MGRPEQDVTLVTSPPGCHESGEACQGNGRASDAPGSLITPFMTGYSGGPLGSPMGTRERERRGRERGRSVCGTDRAAFVIAQK